MCIFFQYTTIHIHRNFLLDKEYSPRIKQCKWWMNTAFFKWELLDNWDHWLNHIICSIQPNLAKSYRTWICTFFPCKFLPFPSTIVPKLRMFCIMSAHCWNPDEIPSVLYYSFDENSFQSIFHISRNLALIWINLNAECYNLQI